HGMAGLRSRGCLTARPAGAVAVQHCCQEVCNLVHLLYCHRKREPPWRHPGRAARVKELLMTIKMPVDDKVLAAQTQTTTPPLYQRGLIAVADAGQGRPGVWLAPQA